MAVDGVDHSRVVGEGRQDTLETRVLWHGDHGEYQAFCFLGPLEGFVCPWLPVDRGTGLVVIDGARQCPQPVALQVGGDDFRRAGSRRLRGGIPGDRALPHLDVLLAGIRCIRVLRFPAGCGDQSEAADGGGQVRWSFHDGGQGGGRSGDDTPVHRWRIHHEEKTSDVASGRYSPATIPTA